LGVAVASGAASSIGVLASCSWAAASVEVTSTGRFRPPRVLRLDVEGRLVGSCVMIVLLTSFAP